MMLRLRCVMPLLRKHLHVGLANRDQVLGQLRVCSVEDQLFDVVGKNKAKLTVDHVTCALTMLWQFKKMEPDNLRTFNQTTAHLQFLTLKILAENKINLMDDLIMIDTLYSLLRMNVEHHDTVIQQLFSEAWLRLDRLSLSSLSKLATCVVILQHYDSPFLGKITNIMDQKLHLIDDLRVLTPLMIASASLVSPRLRDALIRRADHLLSTTSMPSMNSVRRVIQFMHNNKCIDHPLLEKCNKIVLENISGMNVMHISLTLSFSQSMRFNKCHVRLAAKQRLIELIDTCTDPMSFSKLFLCLAPMASREIRGGLENTALLLADEFNAHQAMDVLTALEKMKSKNFYLLNKIASVIQKNLHVYKLKEVCSITKALSFLKYHNPELLNNIRDILVKSHKKSFLPNTLAMLTHGLSLLPWPRLEDGMLTRVESGLGQCSLKDLVLIENSVSKWVDRFYKHTIPNKYTDLLQTLNHCGLEKLQTANKLDLLLDNLTVIVGEWFEEMLLEETMVTLQRMIDQISWTLVPELALFLSRFDSLCPPLLDRIAHEAIENMDKICCSDINNILLPFSLLNYDTEQTDKLYDACIERFTPYISSFDPRQLVFLAYFLAITDRFPQELIREIFNIDFLRKLDSQLETIHYSLKMKTQLCLMQLNRAACIQCPEYQIPWFHEDYYQKFYRRGNQQVSPMQQQIHKMLGEVLGGMNCVRSAVVTPYFYTVNFECKLDNHMQPLCYRNPSMLQRSKRKNNNWDSSLLNNTRDELPPGAQRVAVDFLEPMAFCKNSHHMKGEKLMKMRHLEILGYRVVQIPHYEWNIMELSTYASRKAYLKKKILG